MPVLTGDSYHARTKYGRAVKAAPMSIINIVLDTKYGNAISKTPQASGTERRCFLP